MGAIAEAIPASTSNEEVATCPLPIGCGQAKNLTDFPLNRSRKNNHCAYCSLCCKRLQREYRERAKLPPAEEVRAGREARERQYFTYEEDEPEETEKPDRAISLSSLLGQAIFGPNWNKTGQYKSEFLLVGR